MADPEINPTGCQTCGSLTFSQEWFDVFKVILCPTCKKEEELITKVRPSSSQLHIFIAKVNYFR